MRALRWVTLLVLLAGVVFASSALAQVDASKQTTIHFSFTETHRPHAKGREWTRGSGSGTLTLADTPQVNVPYKSTSATGTLQFHRWKVVGQHVVDEDNVTLDVVSGQYRFTKTSSTAVVEVKVTKTDPSEKDSCAVGSTGEFGLLDGIGKVQTDTFSVNRLCGLHDANYGGLTGKPALVVITVTRGTS
jgi:hypothetical protein